MTRKPGNGGKVDDPAPSGGARSRDLFDRPLPKRFYKSAAATARGRGFAVELDGRPLRTPGKLPLEVPTLALAEALAAEWASQGAVIDPGTMPMTRTVNSAIDAVAPRHGEVVADIAAYAASDLLCYRAEAPRELVQRQHERWDPVLDWAASRLGHTFAVGQGVMPLHQAKVAVAALSEAIGNLPPIALAALHVMTTLTGSALLAFAHAEGRLSAREAWTAAHVDEDWQVSQWGEDAEAGARRARRWEEMAAASRVLKLLAS